MKMKKYLKTFAAVLMVFAGSLAVSYYITNPISYSAMFVGLGGVVILYPAVIGYVKMFDTLFGE